MVILVDILRAFLILLSMTVSEKYLYH
jgi:hypothetical protein